MPHAAGLWYEWHGPESGEVLILSPGLGGSATYWAPNLLAFAGRYRVLLYDHRGTGRSDSALPEVVTVEAMAEDLIGLMQALDLHRVSFVGHALGGLIGLEMALAQPCTIDKLVVINGWAELDPHTARCFDVRLDLLRDSGPAAFVRAQPIFLYPAGWIAEHGDELEAEAARQLTHFPPPEIVEKRIAAARSYRNELLELLACNSILVLASEDDMLVPARQSRLLADRLVEGAGRLAIMPWGGHACNVTDPETFNRLVLEFLGS